MSTWRGQLAVTMCVAGLPGGCRIAAEGAHPWANPSRASMPERRAREAANAEGLLEGFLMTRHQPEICSHPSDRQSGRQAGRRRRAERLIPRRTITTLWGMPAGAGGTVRRRRSSAPAWYSESGTSILAAAAAPIAAVPNLAAVPNNEATFRMAESAKLLHARTHAAQGREPGFVSRAVTRVSRVEWPTRLSARRTATL